jgi:hypothetical protein
MSPRGRSTSNTRSSSARAPGLRGSLPEDGATRRWRRHARPKAVRTAVSATESIRWNRRLLEAILEELYVDDHFEELLGLERGDLRPRQSAQAIAVALILRHSWHPDDLAWILKRLNVSAAGV